MSRSENATRPRRRRNQSESSLFSDQWKLEHPEHNNETDREELGAPTPVTIKLVGVLQDAHEEEYLTWQRGITRDMEQVIHPARVTSILLRQVMDTHQIRFVLLFQFDSKASADAWQESNERKEWLDKLPETNFYQHSNHHQEEEAVVSSMDDFPMFHVASTSLPKQRQRWREAFLVWLQVFGLVELLGVLLPLMLGHVTWQSLSLHLQIAVSTALTTLCIECCTMRLFVSAARLLRFLP